MIGIPSRALMMVKGTLRHEKITLSNEQIEKCVSALQMRDPNDKSVDALKVLLAAQGLAEDMNAQPNLWHSVATLLCRTICNSITRNWED